MPAIHIMVHPGCIEIRKWSVCSHRTLYHSLYGHQVLRTVYNDTRYIIPSLRSARMIISFHCFPSSVALSSFLSLTSTTTTTTTTSIISLLVAFVFLNITQLTSPILQFSGARLSLSLLHFRNHHSHNFSLSLSLSLLFSSSPLPHSLFLPLSLFLSIRKSTHSVVLNFF